MVINARGTFRNGRIELHEGVNLRDGDEVRVTIETAPPLTDDARRRRLLEIAGAVTDPTFFEAVEESERSRRERSKRPPDFDDVSP